MKERRILSVKSGLGLKYGEDEEWGRNSPFPTYARSPGGPPRASYQAPRLPEGGGQPMGGSELGELPQLTAFRGRTASHGRRPASSRQWLGGSLSSPPAYCPREAHCLPAPVSWEGRKSSPTLFFRKFFFISVKTNTKLTHLQQPKHAKLQKQAKNQYKKMFL